MMTLRNAHNLIKAWGRAHDRQIDHESIFTLQGYPPQKRAELRNTCACLEILRMLKIFRFIRRMREKLKKSENQRFGRILIDTVAPYH